MTMNGATIVTATFSLNSYAVLVQPTNGLITSEAGAAATFSVVLTAQPTADVMVTLASSDVSEGTVSPTQMIFTSANWSTPQTATVTGVDDAVADGNIAYAIVPTVSSSDANYNNLAAGAVSVTNLDNDGPGVSVSAISGDTTEAGGQATFTVVLQSQPTGTVTVALASSDVSEGTVSPAALVFTPANWNTPQTATVTGVDDAVDDGNVAYTIVTTVSSDDANYNGIAAGDVSVTNLDNDGPGVIVSAISGDTTEAGGQATFTVVLQSQPTGTVTVALASSDVSEGTVSPAALVFTPANWNTPQTVTVTGVDDDVDDGNVAYTIVTTVSSDDPNYNGIAAADVSVTNTDDDGAATANIYLPLILK